jgi:tetratricopeptide (TPR) repeat protein
MTKMMPKLLSRSDAAARTRGVAVSVWQNPAFVCLLLMASILAVYLPVVCFDFVNFDDLVYVADNTHVLRGLTWEKVKWAFTTLDAGFWQPLTWLSYMLDATIWGKGAGGFHFTNLLLHTANAALLFLLLRQLTGTLWRSALVAALFALHPLHVEPVAWIASRKDVLSTFFGFLSLLFYARYAQSKIANRKSQIANYPLALFFFALSLMSKTMLVTLPFLLLLLDYWPLRRFESATCNLKPATFWRLVREKLPFLALTVFTGLLTVLAEERVDALPSVTLLPLKVRLANALLSYGCYLWQTVWPVNLAIYYPFPKTFPIAWMVVVGLVVVTISILALWQFRRWPHLAVGWFWYVVTLLPVIGLIQVGGHAHADRYTYVPLIGVFLALAWSAERVWTRWRLPKILAGVLAATILFVCLLRTANQLRYWHNSGTLFRHALAVTEKSYVAYGNLGVFLAEVGEVDAGLTNLQKAVQLNPGNFCSLNAIGRILFCRKQDSEAAEVFERSLKIKPDNAEALAHLGMIAAAQGRLPEAIDKFRQALRSDPTELTALKNLGVALLVMGRKDEAITHLQEVLRLDPDCTQVRSLLEEVSSSSNYDGLSLEHFAQLTSLTPADVQPCYWLGQSLLQQGKTADAVRCFEMVLRADPKMVEVHNDLGGALLQLGRVEEAVEQFRLLLEFKPGHAKAHDNLGVALAMKGQFDEAIVHLREAMRLEPGRADTHFNLGNALALRRNLDEAVREYAEAIRLKPGHFQAHLNLGNALLDLGRREEAIQHLRQALRLNPDYEQARQKLEELGVTAPP